MDDNQYILLNREQNRTIEKKKEVNHDSICKNVDILLYV